jgi:hypothetical protein
MVKVASYPAFEPWTFLSFPRDFWYKVIRCLGVWHLSAICLKVLHALHYTFCPLEEAPSFFINFTSFTQYMLWFPCVFGTGIPSETFMYISESIDPYKYAVTTSINCKDRWFCIARDIKYQKVIPSITGEYVSLKSMSGLCVNPCATSLTLYLTTSLFSFLFWMNTHLNSTGKILGGLGITSVNTFLFLSELSSASIASFHLFQSEHPLHSAMVLGFGSSRKFSTMTAKTHGLTIVVLWSYTSPELV